MRDKVARIVATLLIGVGPLMLVGNAHAGTDERIAAAKKTISRLESIQVDLKYPGTTEYLIGLAKNKISRAEDAAKLVESTISSNTKYVNQLEVAQQNYNDAEKARNDFPVWWQTKYIPSLENLYNNAWNNKNAMWLQYGANDDRYIKADREFQEIAATRNNPAGAYKTKQSEFEAAWQTAFKELQSAQEAVASGKSNAIEAPKLYEQAITDMQTAVQSASVEIDQAIQYEITQVQSFSNAEGIVKAKELESRNNEAKATEPDLMGQTPTLDALIKSNNLSGLASARILGEDAVTNDIDGFAAVIAALATINPESLSLEEIESLKIAANFVLDNTDPGSAEYKAAMEALMTLAALDDKKVSEAISGIPILGTLAKTTVATINLFSNAGADLSSDARIRSQKVVVSAVIAGQVTQVSLMSSAVAANSIFGASQVGLRRFT